MKIVDGFTFYNEIGLLELRLELLRDVVDYFVLSEMDVTHSGIRKGLVVEQYLDRLPVARERICYVAVEDAPKIDPTLLHERWRAENFQRNAIARGLERLTLAPDDIVMISDVDEIPDPLAVKRCIGALDDFETAVFCQMYRKYFINALSEFHLGQYWLGTVATRAKTLEKMSPQQLRRGEGFPRAGYLWMTGRAEGTCYIEPGGWHLTYFGGPASVVIKHQNVVEGHESHMAEHFEVPRKSRHNWSQGRTEEIRAWRKSLDASVLPVDPLGTGGLRYLPGAVVSDPLRWEWLWWFSRTIEEGCVPLQRRAGEDQASETSELALAATSESRQSIATDEEPGD